VRPRQQHSLAVQRQQARSRHLEVMPRWAVDAA
jgi:hypothetical protein